MVTLQEVESREKELSNVESQAKEIAAQPIPQRRFGSSITPEVQKQYIQRREQAQSVLMQVKQQRAELQQIKQQVITYNKQVAAANQEQAEWKQAQRFVDTKGFGIEWLPKSVQEKIRIIQARERNYKQNQAYQKQIKTYQEQGLTPVTNSSGQIIGFEDALRQQSIPLTSVPYLPSTDLTRYEKAGVVSITKTQVQTNSLPQNTITAVTQEKKSLSNLYGLPNYLSRKESYLQTQAARGYGGAGTQATLTAIGFTKPFVQTAKAVINPIETTKSLAKALATPKQTFTSIKKDISTTAKTNPSGFVGEALGNIALIQSPKLVTKISDATRVKGLTKIESTDIIAPEYFKGQNYPQITKGQSAGQLLKEFTGPKEVYGVTQLKGFTAAPKPFKATTTALKGTSELPGVYQAPKLSPNFLRVSSENKKLFSLKLTDTLRPSAMKINPKDFELITGVSKRQTRLTSLKQAKIFYETKAKPGKSYIPFIKTEKEAIIPAGTQLQKIDKRFYFEFENRKIPIYEFEALNLEDELAKAVKGISIEEASSKYYNVISDRGIISPTELSLTSSKFKSSSVTNLGSSIKVSSLPSSIVNIKSSYVKVPSSSYSVPKVSSRPITPPSSSISRAPSYSITPIISSPSPVRPSFSLTPRGSSGSPPIKPPKFPPVRTAPLIYGKSKLKRTGGLTPGYRPFVVRKGKEVFIGTKVLPRGEALRIGQKAATGSLRATFGVKQVKGFATGKDTNFKVSNLFRNYRIKEGKKIPLQNTFIQKQGKRLSFSGEKTEIQIARRLKI